MREHEEPPRIFRLRQKRGDFACAFDGKSQLFACWHSGVILAEANGPWFADAGVEILRVPVGTATLRMTTDDIWAGVLVLRKKKKERRPDGIGINAAAATKAPVWKDADPDVPILLQAKAEYAKLQ